MITVRPKTQVRPAGLARALWMDMAKDLNRGPRPDEVKMLKRDEERRGVVAERAAPNAAPEVAASIATKILARAAELKERAKSLASPKARPPKRAAAAS